jgi:hypothetical protein
MALAADPIFGASLALAAGITPTHPAYPLWVAIAAAINAQIKAGDVVATAGTPPMTVAAAPGAVAGFGKVQ